MSKHLKPYGWEYLVIDSRWYAQQDFSSATPLLALDEYGRYLPDESRFPSAGANNGFKPLADYVHALGLEFGIRIMRGIPSEAVEKEILIKDTDGITANQVYTSAMQCTWANDNYTLLAHKAGAQEYYNSIMDLYASWGVDFILLADAASPYHQIEIEMIRKAIDQTGQDILLCLAEDVRIEKTDHVKNFANMWPLSKNIDLDWELLLELIDNGINWNVARNAETWPYYKIAFNGHSKEQHGRLTPDELNLLLTFLYISKFPVAIEGAVFPGTEDLPFIYNQEISKMLHESTGLRTLMYENNRLVLLSHNAATQEVYLALFNLDDRKSCKFQLSHSDLGLNKKYKVMNLHTEQKPSRHKRHFTDTLKPHEARLYVLSNR